MAENKTQSSKEKFKIVQQSHYISFDSKNVIIIYNLNITFEKW